MPYCILAFWYLPVLRSGKREKPSLERLLFGIVALFLLISTFLNLGNKGGLQWGPRYLMPVYSLLVILSLKVTLEETIFRPQVFRILITILFGFAFLLECVGFAYAREDEKGYDQVIQYLKDQPAIAVVGYRDYWILQTCSPLYFEKRLHYVGSPEEFKAFLESPKPYPNNSVIVISRQKPLDEQLPELKGSSEVINLNYYAWSPQESD